MKNALELRRQIEAKELAIEQHYEAIELREKQARKGIISLSIFGRIKLFFMKWYARRELFHYSDGTVGVVFRHEPLYLVNYVAYLFERKGYLDVQVKSYICDGDYQISAKLPKNATEIVLYGKS